MSTFSEKIQQATSEDKDVNPAYREELAKEIPKIKNIHGAFESNNTEFGILKHNNGEREVYCEINTLECLYPHIKTDGIFEVTCRGNGETRNFLLQLECKLDVDFNDVKERAKVLLQVCCYLKQIKFEQPKDAQTWKANAIPKVVVLGSKLNCLALPTNILFQHADKQIYGYKSASTAYLNVDNNSVIEGILDDSSITQYSIVRDVTDKNCIKALSEQILRLGNELKITDDLNEHTMSLAFDFFDMYVLDEKFSKNMSSREKVDIFIGVFFNDEFEEIKTNRYATSYDKIKVHGIEVKVNMEKYNQFKLLYAVREYSRLEQKQITAITDRLIEDTDRRRKGDFYTPSIWVDEAHKLLDKNLGDNWRDEYMVWDCAWGTGNLTRDYKFADLYCSTLQDQDLNIGYRYNRGACKFQYDFLNDDVDDFERIDALCKMGRADTANAVLYNTKLYKTAPGLINGLLGLDFEKFIEHKDRKVLPKKKLLFLINPPYGTSAELKNVHADVDHKIGIGDTKINELMTDEKIGTCSRQLVAQFMYRINLIKTLFNADVSLAMFSPTSVLTSNDYEGLLNKIDNHLGFTDGIMFCASEFADVKSTWGIMFSLYNSNNLRHERRCIVDVMSIQANGKAEKLFFKTLYMISKKAKASWWTKEPIEKCNKSKNACYLKSALNTHDGKPHNQCIDNSIGGFISSANNVNENTQFVALLSSMSGAAKGLNLGKENYDRVISLFTARKLISGQYANWINSKDEYMIPDTSHRLYKQWQSDCIVYSLFNTASNQSSLRNISYNGKQWNIQNEFFWMSVKDIETLAGGKYDTADINTSIEDDIDTFGKERFVYKKLQEVTLSPDAQAVLDKATEIVKKSFKYRKDFNQKHPEYHINTWDAGWYQIKGLCKEYPVLKAELEEFNTLYKQLEDRMRPLVYELGFLYP